MERIWDTHRGRLIGLVIGVVLGLIYLIVGFWKTVAFGMFVLVGFLIGQQWDDRDGLKEMLESINPGKWLRKR
ncbi:DUF2273 domain-containing protein [Desmospora activa]|uniref:Small integral membrane protein DUF2273 n=1 Tax=Desmospora activa DSM 45169 TaxID=1121389 RepID=A0A2T4Z9G7_9BACL|nr:DUF2273 domain-containing protein [Desmospora activa]PTM58529.1 small integral membrane protein DUF2273 [Desmospora activa DSM 45169]